MFSYFSNFSSILENIVDALLSLLNEDICLFDFLKYTLFTYLFHFSHIGTSPHSSMMKQKTLGV